jgi:hypothetical protein
MGSVLSIPRRATQGVLEQRRLLLNLSLLEVHISLTPLSQPVHAEEMSKKVASVFIPRFITIKSQASNFFGSSCPIKIRLRSRTL